MNIHAPSAAANIWPKAEFHVNKQAVTRQAAECLVLNNDNTNNFCIAIGLLHQKWIIQLLKAKLDMS